jgi:hypothetical protein
MNEVFLLSTVAAVGFVAVGTGLLEWLRQLERRRWEVRRAQGYRLIHALQAYSAWIDCQRDLPFAAKTLADLSLPEPLIIVREIKREWFPSLVEQMVPLLQAHSRMMEYLWEQTLLRLTQGSAWKPAYEDAKYQELRDAQEDLIDELIAKCRELIGDNTQVWQRTGSDFAFSTSSVGRNSGPASI